MHSVTLLIDAIFISVCFDYILPICDPGTCQPGTYFDKRQRECLPCPPGTFLNKADHKCTDCKSCSQPDKQNHEIKVQNCTSVSDTKIGCSDSYYRKEDAHHGDGECEICKKCPVGQIEVCKCDLYHDTLCCENCDLTDDAWNCDTGTKKVTQGITSEKREEQYYQVSSIIKEPMTISLNDKFSTPVKILVILSPFIMVFLVSDPVLIWYIKLMKFVLSCLFKCKNRNERLSRVHHI